MPSPSSGSTMPSCPTYAPVYWSVIITTIEGIEPSPEMATLFAMFLQERAPLPVSEPFLDRYIRDVLV